MSWQKSNKTLITSLTTKFSNLIIGHEDGIVELRTTEDLDKSFESLCVDDNNKKVKMDETKDADNKVSKNLSISNENEGGDEIEENYKIDINSAAISDLLKRELVKLDKEFIKHNFGPILSSSKSQLCSSFTSQDISSSLNTLISLHYPLTHRVQAHFSRLDYLESVDIPARIETATLITSGTKNSILAAASERSVAFFRKNNLTYNKFLEFEDLHSYTCNSLRFDNCEAKFLSSDFLQIKYTDIERENVHLLVDKKEKQGDLKFLVTDTYLQSNFEFGYCTTLGKAHGHDLRVGQEEVFEVTVPNYNIYNCVSRIARFGDLIVTRDVKGLNYFDIRNKTMIRRVDLLVESDDFSKLIYERLDMEERDGQVLTGDFYGRIHIVGDEVKTYKVGQEEMTCLVRCVCWEDDRIVGSIGGELVMVDLKKV